MSKLADESIKKALETMKENNYLDKKQKEYMLNKILLEAQNDNTFLDNIRRFIFEYPWRFAFSISVIQSSVCTLIFGNQYTNIFINMIGGR